MGDNKDNNYNDTGKQGEEPFSSKPAICGIKAEPGLMHQSGVVATICNNCGVVATNVESSWNIKSYICCYYYGPCWWCYQTVKGKDYTLKNGKHTCSKCNTDIYDYSSCE